MIAGSVRGPDGRSGSSATLRRPNRRRPDRDYRLGATRAAARAISGHSSAVSCSTLARVHVRPPTIVAPIGAAPRRAAAEFRRQRRRTRSRRVHEAAARNWARSCSPSRPLRARRGPRDPTSRGQATNVARAARTRRGWRGWPHRRAGRRTCRRPADDGRQVASRSVPERPPRGTHPSTPATRRVVGPALPSSRARADRIRDTWSTSPLQDDARNPLRPRVPAARASGAERAGQLGARVPEASQARER